MPRQLMSTRITGKSLTSISANSPASCWPAKSRRNRRPNYSATAPTIAVNRTGRCTSGSTGKVGSATAAAWVATFCNWSSSSSTAASRGASPEACPNRTGMHGISWRLGSGCRRCRNSGAARRNGRQSKKAIASPCGSARHSLPLRTFIMSGSCGMPTSLLGFARNTESARKRRSD